MLKITFGLLSLIGMGIGLTLGGFIGFSIVGVLCFIFLVFGNEWFA